MTRPTVTVLVTPVADEQATRRCLEALRRTLRRDDQVVLLDGSEVEPVTTDLVADLHADVVVTPHWLDRLAAALDDPGVQAAGPRCNLAPPGQFVADVPYGNGRATSLRDHARLWAAAHDTVRTADLPLSGSCRVRRAVPTSGRQVVVDAVLVHHEAATGCPDLVDDPDPDGQPLLSAALIVKNEQDVLADCLRSLVGFCDEVVVYDTGSTDATREIAADHGAVVVEGYWDESFGAARNRGLEHCTGRWVLWVDADEVLRGDVEALRAALRTDRREGLLIAIRNLGDRGAGSDVQHVALRLFRRSTATLVGRLHEQVVHRRLGRSLAGGSTDLVSLDHCGYQAARFEVKDKAQRNLDLAVRASEAAVDPDPQVTVNLARSLGVSGDLDQALSLMEDAWHRPLHDTARRQLATEAMLHAMRLGDLGLAGRWIDRRAVAGELPHPVQAARAVLLERQGEHARALRVVEQLPTSWTDADGLVTDALSLAGLHASLLGHAGRHREAADLLVTALRAQFLDVPLVGLVEALRRAGRPLADLVTAVPPRLRVQVAAQCAALDSADADDLLEALWRLEPGTELLVAAADLAAALSVRRAMEWSVRLRSRGLDEHCPLLRLAADDGRTPRDRVLAAACAHEHLDDPRAMNLLQRALGDVDEPDEVSVLAELVVLAPRLAAAVEPSCDQAPAVPA